MKVILASLFLVSAVLAVHETTLVRRHGNHGHGHGHSHDDHDHHHHHHEPVCGTVFVESEFNQALHYGALFLVLAISGIGCFITGLMKRMGIVRIPYTLINVFRHFGTGVIISTAFIHMLIEAVTKFQHECAPKFVREDYISTSTLIVMVAIFLVHLIETILVSRINDINREESENEIKNEKEKEKLNEIDLGHHHHHHNSLEKFKLSTYILELGILSHSVFIGISLGVAGDSELYTLLVAICFHQFFEGLGLGARIADIPFESAWQPLFMILSYAITTPIGVLIGILIRYSYSTSSPSGIIIQGTFDAISAGILIYTGLVELMGKELNIDGEFGRASWGIRSLYLFSLYAGAAAMSIIGMWA